MSFTNQMIQYWRNHQYAKAVLERNKMAKYKKVIELQRPGEIRWKSQEIAASALLKSQCATEKAVANASFKKHCLLEGRPESRQAAVAVVEAVKRDENWEELRVIQQVLKPLSDALDGGQADINSCLALGRLVATAALRTSGCMRRGAGGGKRGSAVVC